MIKLKLISQQIIVLLSLLAVPSSSLLCTETPTTIVPADFCPEVDGTWKNLLSNQKDRASYICKQSDSINTKDTLGYTALKSAISANDKEMLTLLQTNRSLVFAIEGYVSVLEYALNRGKPINIIQLLLTDQRTTQENIYECIRNAVRTGKYLDRLLTTLDPETAIRNDWYKKILLRAISSQESEVLEKILNIDHIDITAKYDNDATILHEFWKDDENLEGILKILLKYPHVNVKDKEGKTPLHYAMKQHFIDCNKITLLLDHPDTDINAKDNNGETPFYYLICRLIKENYEHIELINLFVHHKDFDPNVQCNGHTALTKLMREVLKFTPFLLKVVSVLLNHPNTDPNVAEEEFNKTPLHWATGNSNVDGIKLLLQHKKINIEKKDISKTPLQRIQFNLRQKMDMSAETIKQWEIIEDLLLKHNFSQQ